MIRSLLMTSAVLIGISAVVAQEDPIASRKSLMKSVGAATATGNRIVKGAAPFDLDKTQEIFKTYATASDKMHTYFPETSKTGGETTASPKIWESQADFRKRFDDWAADIKKAAANTKDLDTFKAEFANVTKACGSCHQAYRISGS